jgi:hypothetical protein
MRYDSVVRAAYQPEASVIKMRQNCIPLGKRSWVPASRHHMSEQRRRRAFRPRPSCLARTGNGQTPSQGKHSLCSRHLPLEISKKHPQRRCSSMMPEWNCGALRSYRSPVFEGVGPICKIESHEHVCARVMKNTASTTPPTCRRGVASASQQEDNVCKNRTQLANANALRSSSPARTITPNFMQSRTHRDLNAKIAVVKVRGRKEDGIEPKGLRHPPGLNTRV